MIGLALAALLYVAPSDVTPTPVATPAPLVSVEPPNEGRPNGAGGWDPSPAVALPELPTASPTAPSPARPPARVLAQTGVPVAPYALVGALLVGAGGLLVRVSRRTSR